MHNYYMYITTNITKKLFYTGVTILFIGNTLKILMMQSIEKKKSTDGQEQERISDKRV